MQFFPDAESGPLWGLRAGSRIGPVRDSGGLAGWASKRPAAIHADMQANMSARAAIMLCWIRQRCFRFSLSCYALASTLP